MPGSVERFRQERSKQQSRSRSPRRRRSRSPLNDGNCQSNRITISNIPYDMTWVKLKELIKEEVGQTGFVEMVESNGKPVGMASVEFKTPETATLAVKKLHKFQMGDRHLVVREETGRDRERIAQYKSNVNSEDLIDLMNFMAPMLLERLGLDGPVTDSIHISNVDFSTSWQDIKDLFRLAGNVVLVDIRQDNDGRSRGFGIVKFSAPYEAVQAISMFNNQLFRGRPLRVKNDREGAPPRQIPRVRLPEVEAQARELLPVILKQIACGATRNVKSLTQAVRLRSVPDGCPVVGSGFGPAGLPLRSGHDIGLWIQELLREQSAVDRIPSYDFRRPEIAALPEVTIPALARTETDRLSGLQTILSAAMRGGMKEDEVLRVASSIGLQKLLPTESAPRDYGEIMRSTSLERLNRMDISRTLGPSPARGRMVDRISTTSKERVPLTNTFGGSLVENGGGKKSIMIKNLPYSYTEQDLRRSFTDIANVRNVNLLHDANNRSRGTAYIDFFTAADAERAAKIMNGVRFEGREISVEIS